MKKYLILVLFIFIISISFANSISKNVSNTDLSKKFFQLVADNKLEEADKLLKTDLDPNALVDNTPLLYRAIDLDSFTAVKLLVKNGADVDRGLNEFYPTSLHYITIPYKSNDKKLQIIELLARKTKKINYKDKYGRTPFLLACISFYGGINSNCETDILKILIVNGADVNTIDNKGISYANLLASSYITTGNKLLVFLKNNGLKDIRSNILKAAMDNDLGKLKKVILNDKKQINTSYGGITALLHAVENNNMEMVKFLLENGADPNISESISTAIHQNNLAMIDLLFKYGANPNTAIYDLDSLAFYLITNIVNKPKILKIFLKYQTKKDVQEIMEHINLFELAVKNPYSLKLLLDKGYDPYFIPVKQYSFDGSQKEVIYNPLYHIFRYDRIIDKNIAQNKLESTKILLEYGISPNEVICEKNDCDYLINYVLRRYQTNPEVYYEIVKLFLEHGAYVDYINSENETPLSIASEINDTKLTELLNKYAKKIKKANKSKDKIKLQEELLKAVKNNDFNKVQLLINEGADPNYIYKDGKTLFGEAIFTESNMPIAKLLIYKGADVNNSYLLNNFYLHQTIRPTYALNKLIAEKISSENIKKYGVKILDTDLYYVENKRVSFDYKLAGNFIENNNLSLKAMNIDRDYSTIYIAVKNKDKKLLKYLLERGVNPDFAGVNEFFLPLEQAILNKDYDIAKMIVDYGANINMQFIIRGRYMGFTTLLHEATKKCSYEDIEWLLVKGAKTNLKDSDGKTVQDLISNCGYGNLKIIKLRGMIKRVINIFLRFQSKIYNKIRLVKNNYIITS